MWYHTNKDCLTSTSLRGFELRLRLGTRPSIFVDVHVKLTFHLLMSDHEDWDQPNLFVKGESHFFLLPLAVPASWCSALPPCPNASSGDWPSDPAFWQKDNIVSGITLHTQRCIELGRSMERPTQINNQLWSTKQCRMCCEMHTLIIRPLYEYDMCVRHVVSYSSVRFWHDKFGANPSHMGDLSLLLGFNIYIVLNRAPPHLYHGTHMGARTSVKPKQFDFNVWTSSKMLSTLFV